MSDPTVPEMLSAFKKNVRIQVLNVGETRYRAALWRVAQDRDESPQLVFLHGFKNNLYSFADLLPRLDRPAIAFDFRGHGGTRTPDMPFISLPEYLWDLKQILDHFCTAPVVLIGHSLGGRVAVAFAALFPERVDRVVVLDAVHRIYAPQDWPERMRRWLEQADRPPLPRPTVAPERIAEFLERQSPSIHPDLARFLAHQSHLERPPGEGGPDWDPFLQRPTPTPFDDRMMTDSLERIEAPTLAIQCATATLGEIKPRNPLVSRTYISGSHHLHWEQPAEVARAIEDWWNR